MARQAVTYAYAVALLGKKALLLCLSVALDMRSMLALLEPVIGLNMPLSVRHPLAVYQPGAARLSGGVQRQGGLCARGHRSERL